MGLQSLKLATVFRLIEIDSVNQALSDLARLVSI